MLLWTSKPPTEESTLSRRRAGDILQRCRALTLLLAALLLFGCSGPSQGLGDLKLVSERALMRLKLTLEVDDAGHFNAGGLQAGRALPPGEILLARRIEGWPKDGGDAPVVAWFETLPPSAETPARLRLIRSLPDQVLRQGLQLEMLSALNHAQLLDKSVVTVSQNQNPRPLINRGLVSLVSSGDAYVSLREDPSLHPAARIRSVFRVATADEASARLSIVAGRSKPMEDEKLLWFGPGFEAPPSARVLIVFSQDWDAKKPETWPGTEDIVQLFRDDLFSWQWGRVEVSSWTLPTSMPPGEAAHESQKHLFSAGLDSTLRGTDLVLWFTPGPDDGVQLHFAGRAAENLEGHTDLPPLTLSREIDDVTQHMLWLAPSRAVLMQHQRRWPELLWLTDPSSADFEIHDWMVQLRARALARLGAAQEALTTIDPLLKSDDEHARGAALRMVAEWKAQLGDLDGALSALTLAPAEGRTLLLRAQLLARLQRHAEAISALNAPPEGMSARLRSIAEVRRMLLEVRLLPPGDDAWRALLNEAARLPAEEHAKILLVAGQRALAAGQERDARAHFISAAERFEESGHLGEAGVARLEALRVISQKRRVSFRERTTVIREVEHAAKLFAAALDYSAAGETLLIGTRLAWGLVIDDVPGDWVGVLSESLRLARRYFAAAQRPQRVAEVWQSAAQVFIEHFEDPKSALEAMIAANLYAMVAGDRGKIAETEFYIAVLLGRLGVEDAADADALRAQIRARLDVARRFAESIEDSALLDKITAAQAELGAP